MQKKFKKSKASIAPQKEIRWIAIKKKGNNLKHPFERQMQLYQLYFQHWLYRYTAEIFRCI